MHAQFHAVDSIYSGSIAAKAQPCVVKATFSGCRTVLILKFYYQTVSELYHC